MTPDELDAELRKIGQERYHNRHPFHRLLHDGKLNRGQVQAWALNRYYYQSRIPAKDAALLSRLPTVELRREWRRRVEDHDGSEINIGGVGRWRKLVLPGTRFAVDAYVNFVKERSLLEAIASSLTELFSPNIIAERVSGMLSNYSWITQDTLAYFTPRLTQAPKDSDFALAYVKTHADTVEKQQQVLAALRFKCDVLWTQLDVLYFSYVSPGFIPPGAFRPQL
jgi:pyrroloquinoline-quinone synthase